MRKIIYDDGAMAIINDDGKFYIRYDVGTHQIKIREDEISEDEANLAMVGTAEATRVLFAVQRRLQLAGVDPYVSNT
ncbi:hypothetical protein UAJ10_10415 [Nitrospirillum sp. BR 11164]|uniref:hypothetical protein n=1 Tax=Nitrospirillum sp. BR 11164 TaxID=3104324 RepID=UPI002AFEB5B3|nr:hypothetical protein [Nitrospirillum sp. BR 11164]MEA1649431.1 hypothetical protein [Nitrospirillum sp. BR 11164]